MKIAVLGAGAWGTALAVAWATRESPHAVSLWSRDDGHADAMRRARRNPLLPEIELPAAIEPQEDFGRAIENADLAVVATPVAGLRATARVLAAQAPNLPIVWVCKGFEAGSGMLPHQVVGQEIDAPGTDRGARCGTLSGPSFALEVARRQPTAVTFAARDAVWAESIARELHTARLRVYAHDDLVGAEVGGAVKNVLAIATGISDGLQLGYNARAALMTRGLAEIARLGVAMGARQETFMGLAGIGDLMLTCTGDLSRNRRVGLGLAEGKPLARILDELGHVAEGVSTAREVVGLAARHRVEMPIAQAVAAVLDGRLAARDGVEQLLSRSPRPEF